jgi:hypothetical protein
MGGMRRTPLLTLVSGLVLGGVVTAWFAAASHRPAAKSGPPPATAAATPSAAASPSAAAAPVQVNVTWAGEVDGGDASIAISVHDGVAVAYLCDGKREAWLQGTAADGKLTLTGKNGATLTGTYAAGAATGSVNAAGKQWTFTAQTATPPSGLYRSAEIVNSAKVVCGWIVLANGKQVGACTPEGKETYTAPPLNPANAKPLDPKDYQ